MAGEEKKKTGAPKYWWRRISQVLFLLLFLFLFRQTDGSGGADHISPAVNLFFRIDPLVAASAMLAAKAFIALALPALILVVLTLALGRFFCGWVCPLGTCLDAAHAAARPRHIGESGKYRAAKYYLLALILASALFGFQIVGYFDPFSILFRGLALGADPALNAAVQAPFDYILQHDPLGASAVSEPVFGFLKKWLLPYRQTVFTGVFFSVSILIAVFALEKIERRFWCRNVCPLGAMLALLSRFSRLRINPGKACLAGGCSSCVDICRMGAIREDGSINPEACNLCLDCVEECPKHLLGFKFKRPKAAPAPLGVGRRGLLGALGLGLFLPALDKAVAGKTHRDPKLIRPPGARAEEEFLARCVRCGECMKVCINNALHPAALEAGVEGVFTPVLIPRLGYCEYNCALCGQACPTGAIGELAKEDKQKVRVGRAYFDQNRCMPWAKGIPCLVCEEMCPLPDKAIKVRDEVVQDPSGQWNIVKRPFVVDELCIGCGTCENVCPLPGDAAVLVTREGESRDPESVAPAYGYGGYGDGGGYGDDSGGEYY